MTLLGMDDEKLKIFNTELDKKHKQLELIVTQKKWAAYLKGTQNNITDITLTRIDFDGIIHDCEGVGFTDDGYLISERGLYLAVLSVTWINIEPDKSFRALLRFTHANYRKWDFQQSSVNTYLTNNVSLIGYGEIGDKIQGYVYHDSGVNTPDLIAGMEYTRLDIHLLSRFCF